MTGFTFTHGPWYKGEFDWRSTTAGDVGLTLYDSDGRTVIAPGTATDATANGRGIGFYTDVESPTVYADSVQVAPTTMLGNFENDLDGWEPRTVIRSVE